MLDCSGRAASAPYIPPIPNHSIATPRIAPTIISSPSHLVLSANFLSFASMIFSTIIPIITPPRTKDNDVIKCVNVNSSVNRLGSFN